MLNFYDFEVFKHDWMVVVINPVTRDERVIINDADALTALYEGHKRDIWVGYNNLHYDQFIFKGILCGFDPKAINDFIIVEGRKGWQYSSLLRKVYMVNYDVFHPRTDRGLKTHEAYLGNDIRETTVPFDIDRKLTEAEVAETVKYCRHDVEQTIEVFMQRKSEFDARMDLLKMFDLPLVYLGKTDAQLTAIILGAERPARPRDDEFDIEPLACLDLGPYDFIRSWYLDPANQDYSATLDFDIAGCPHKCAWGGLHGAIAQYAGEGYFINVDVESYYPAEMIAHELLSRNVRDPSKFKGIRDHRIELKHAKDPRQKALKLVVNGTYGASKDKFNALYDPRQATWSASTASSCSSTSCTSSFAMWGPRSSRAIPMVCSSACLIVSMAGLMHFTTASTTWHMSGSTVQVWAWNSMSLPAFTKRTSTTTSSRRQTGR